jgi:flagellar hook-associated protein FlgK
MSARCGDVRWPAHAAIDQLSALVDVSVIPSDNYAHAHHRERGPARDRPAELSTPDSDQFLRTARRLFPGADITSQITSGQLAGTLQARDQQIPAIQTQLDTLASGLANCGEHGASGGFDLNGNAGTNLFNPPPAPVWARPRVCRLPSPTPR